MTRFLRLWMQYDLLSKNYRRSDGVAGYGLILAHILPAHGCNCGLTSTIDIVLRFFAVLILGWVIHIATRRLLLLWEYLCDRVVKPAHLREELRILVYRLCIDKDRFFINLTSNSLNLSCKYRVADTRHSNNAPKLVHVLCNKLLNIALFPSRIKEEVSSRVRISFLCPEICFADPS